MDLKKVLKDIIKLYEIKNIKNKWSNSYFENFKKLSTTEKGDIIEDFLEKILKELKFNVSNNKDEGIKHKKEWDLLINNKTAEVKSATEDTNGNFQFNGIRKHRNYEFIIVVGISPNNLFFNIYKGEDVKNNKIGKLVNMEKDSNLASYKLTRNKNSLFELNSLEIFKKIASEFF